MNWMLMPLRRYADFNGRSRRKEYWLWALFNLIVFLVLYVILTVTAVSAISAVDERGGLQTSEYSSYDSSESGFEYDSGTSTQVDPAMFFEEFSTVGWIVFGLLVLWWLFTLIPNLAVGIRRLHDTDKSGWMLLLGLIPLVGPIILLVFYCIEGTRGPNRFGPDPKGAGHEDTFR
jgi:uncharacterized membrane protein YhaH (DUF805 family)